MTSSGIRRPDDVKYTLREIKQGLFVPGTMAMRSPQENGFHPSSLH
jgi:hypothetical protein